MVANMHYVYIIQSAVTGNFYIGSTADIRKRLSKHNKNEVRSTKNKGPWMLIHKEEFETKRQALCREHRIKSFKGNSSFKRIVDTSSPSSSLV